MSCEALLVLNSDNDGCGTAAESPIWLGGFPNAPLDMCMAETPGIESVEPVIGFSSGFVS